MGKPVNNKKKHRYIIDGVTVYAYNYTTAYEIYRMQRKY